MHKYETFAECLKRCLQEEGLSASEAARLVGFRSRNSIFRILAGDTGSDVNLRFLHQLHDALGNEWPDEQWYALQEALSLDRLGMDKYRANQAFRRLLHEKEPTLQAEVRLWRQPEKDQVCDLGEILDQVARAAQTEIVITGCCDGALSQLLVEHCSEAGDQGRLRIRQYIDIEDTTITQHILGALPLMSKSWYNARLVDPAVCSEELMALYRMHVLHICCQDDNGQQRGGMLVRFDKTHFVTQWRVDGAQSFMQVLDRLRFDLELLKPLIQSGEGPEIFVDYTRQYAQLEDNCAIYSIKPDPHFNCIPTELLENAVMEGFEQSGLAAGPELMELIRELKRVHDQRFDNMINKHRPTHLVYSLPLMERFMRTGVLSDQFFLQRAYRVEERRKMIRVLLDAMREKPYFNVHLLKPEVPPLRYEISYYEGKGVLLMDAYTGYELNSGHSEALITLPAFMESVKHFFTDELIVHYVLSRADTIRELERLLVMNIQE